jgi:hypothetical protein
MMNDLPEELLHLILSYYTNTYQGLMKCRCLNKSFQVATETSEIWLFCDLTFYCPKEYLILVHKKRFKIINDNMLRFFVEYSAFFGLHSSRFILFQPFSFTQSTVKVSVDKLKFLPQRRNDSISPSSQKLLAREVCRWFLKVIGTYHYWWNYYIQTRKKLDAYYRYFHAKYFSFLLPTTILFCLILFIYCIYCFYDLWENATGEKLQIVEYRERPFDRAFLSQERNDGLSVKNQRGFYCSYLFCGITLGFCLMKELWKYLHRMEYRDDENDPLFSLDEQSNNNLVNAQLRTIFLVSTGYDDVLLGFPLSLFATVALFHFRILSFSRARAMDEALGFSAEYRNIDVYTLWVIGIVPFVAWLILTLNILYQRSKEAPLTSPARFLFCFLGFTAISLSLGLLYLDSLVSLNLFVYSLVPYVILDIMLSVVCVTVLNHLLATIKEARYYPIIDYQMKRKIFLLGGFLLSILIMVISSFVLSFQLYFQRKLYVLTSILSYLFGFLCLLTVYAFDELITKYYQIEAG